MFSRRSLGRPFEWLWSAYAVSTYGSAFGFGAMSIIAIRAVRAGPVEVSLLTSVGLAAGAFLAVPLGPWVEFRSKRPVMIATDLIRFGAQATIPAAYALGLLTFVQLLLVTVVLAGARIAFQSASGAHLKALVAPDDLLAANARFESTTWSAFVIGPPLGGAAIGLFGVVSSISADAMSYLLSALGIGMIRTPEPAPPKPEGYRGYLRELPEAWRYLLGEPALRGMFLYRLLLGSFILCTEPLLAVLMLRRLDFPPWQYALAFGLPCVGGLIGSRLAPGLVARHGQLRVITIFGLLNVGWPIGLAFIPAGPAGLLMVMALQFGMVTSIGIFNPVASTYRLEQIEPARLARTLSAWSVSRAAVTALLTALWGLLAELTGLRAAIAIAGALALPIPLLLPRRTGAVAGPASKPATAAAGTAPA